MSSEKTHPIKNLNEDEGLSLSHPQQRIVSVPKHVTELLDVVFRICIEFGEPIEHSNVRSSIFQKLKEPIHRRPFPHLLSPRRLYDLPKLIRKSKFLPL